MLENFDYRVDCDDYLLYELGRLIEEDRALFEDDEFRRVIEEGVHEHIERRLEIRAEIAMRMRSGPAAARAWRVVEDIEAPVRNLAPVVQSYTAYLFRRLEECAEKRGAQTDRIAQVADDLFDSLDDRAATGKALDTLGGIRTSVSARVLAHVISEPTLDEDLEAKAYGLVRAMWPLPRHFILYSLKPHTHEDIPFRWFQLLIECDEPSAVDRILEEVLVHAADPNFREDLLALIGLLAQSHDPGIDDKIMQVLNSEDPPPPAVAMLEAFLKNTKQTLRPNHTGPWAALDRLYAANRKYLALARMFDEGRKADAARKLDELLRDQPEYPFAVMLKRLISRDA
jgi:hypothetical protein